MELTQYIRLLRKWLWLILLVAFLGGSSSFIFRSRQERTYQAQVTIFVGSFREDPNPGSGEINTGTQLATTYAALATTYSIAQAAVEAGGFPVSPDRLRSSISTSIVPETSLLVLSVTYTDPILAADMANQVAEQLILNSPTNLTPDQQSQLDLANAEIDRLTGELDNTRQDLTVIDGQLETETDPDEIASLTTRRDTLVEQITSISSTIAQYSSTVENLRRRTNSLEIIEPARVPSSPTGTGTLQVTLLGAMVGAALAFGAVLLIEYLNDTIKMPEEVTHLLSVPVLGTIFRFGRSGEEYTKRLITYLQPNSPVSESYRTLRTNLLYTSQNGGKQAYIVTSPGPEEGKSVTAANLAVVMATAGLQVLLVDADLRRPKVHEIFDLKNEIGLTTLLFADPTNPSKPSEADVEKTNAEFSTRLRQCIQSTSVPRLRVITSGFIPSNPAEILGSALMKRWFELFQSSTNIDVIIFDTPPVLVVADSAVLAATINVPVLLVVQAGRTRRGAALRTKDQLDTLGAELVGVSLNQLNPAEQNYGYGYGGSYYYYYANSENGQGQLSAWRRLVSRFKKPSS